MQLRKSTLILIFTAILFLSGCQINETENISIPDAINEFHFSILKVGKADAIILQTQNHHIMIDCGETDDSDEVIEFLEENDISKIDYLFITHFDKDHVGGAAEVIKNTEVGSVITPDYQGTNDEYISYLQAVQKAGISPLALTEKKTYVLDDVLLEVYPPQKKAYSEGDNDFSLLISITHGENNFLFTGDAEAERIAEILTVINGEYEFLKVPHHGRYSDKTESLIKQVHPEYAIITDSDKNPAEQKTVTILNKYGSKVYYTKDGDISVSSNGTEITINQ